MKKRIVLVLLLCSMFLLTFYIEVIKAEFAIWQIGSVSMDSLEKIENAERLYDALTENRRDKVDNNYQLYSARVEYDRMVIRIQEGINVIASIGEVTKDSADAIALARQIYNELETAGLARYVTNDYVLTAAEDEYARLLLDEAD